MKWIGNLSEHWLVYLGTALAKYEKYKKNHKITHNEKKRQNRKSTSFHTCWESWSTSMIRSLYCSTRTKWSEFIIVFNTNCKTKITKLPKRQESVKTSKALVFKRGGNGWNSCCASNIKCLSCPRKTKSTRFVTLLNTNYSILGLQVLN